MRESWADLFRSLGQSVLGLVQAEIGAVEEDVSRWSKEVAVGAALLAAAGAFGFWTVGVLTYFLIHLVAIWLPLWGAALVVTGVFALVAGLLAWLGLRKLQRYENPLTAARLRFDDHIEWWQRDVLAPGEPRPYAPPVTPPPVHPPPIDPEERRAP